ncbi:hypothetical protein [Massilia antarctica]|uniref:hypothetical protein n=1 Tax=Massilia antarctica TaxID=2765360 RepID=UPI0035EB8383
MANLSDFFAHVLPYVTGCSYPLAEQHIRDICIDFCSHAPVAQVATDPLDVVHGERQYDIDTPSESVATIILEAAYYARPLRIVKTGDMHLACLQGRTGEPWSIQQAATNVFTLDATPTQDAAQAIKLLVATRPTRTADTVADVLLDDYAFDIGQGVVGRLMRIAGHEFTNLAAAGLYTREYEIARTAARIRAEQSFGRTASRVRPRAFC